MNVTASAVPAKPAKKPGQIFEYSDGSVEEELLKLFSSPDSEEQVQRILVNNPTWEQLYHLSPVRENLLDWYPFTARASLLEVGAGCGALTGLFCRLGLEVTAVELSKRRAEIVRRRHGHHKNLNVFDGNIHSQSISKKFRYVTSVGVLEYAARFTEARDPYATMLQQLRSYLEPDGTFVLAIENRLGLKYWSGAGEDHTNVLFESIADYPSNPKIKTFGRVELETLLRSVGYNNLQFYYPLPDYKTPNEIFSDAYLPSSQHPIRSGNLPTPDLAHGRVNLFDERRAIESLVANKLFPHFANSFLVFAKQ
jgi:2-polyprenyl-3-methyl-5-hydroxy-6-metoxy-1,4-benzoquinol methylase